MIEILNNPFFATLQDAGRFGYRHLGITTQGALDPQSFERLNILLGNSAKTAAIELLMSPMTVCFQGEGWFAFTGSPVIARLNAQEISTGWRYRYKSGDILAIPPARQGVCIYLGVAGGFNVPSVLGSYSTDLNATFGGHQGRLLKEGDRLMVNHQSQRFTKVKGIQPLVSDGIVRVLKGAEFDWFSAESQQSFFTANWQVSTSSNRMGYRLQGQALTLTQHNNLLSRGVGAGTIQVPPQGQPIILMAGSQTTGGYPRIANVLSIDLWKVAQARPNSLLSFQWIDFEEAKGLLKAHQHQLYRLKWGATE